MERMGWISKSRTGCRCAANRMSSTWAAALVVVQTICIQASFSLWAKTGPGVLPPGPCTIRDITGTEPNAADQAASNLGQETTLIVLIEVYHSARGHHVGNSEVGRRDFADMTKRPRPTMCAGNEKRR